MLPRLKNTAVGREDAEESREMERTKFLGRDAGKNHSNAFTVGQDVWLQDRNGIWNIPANILRVRPKGASYRVITDEGKEFLRNRKYLKKRNGDLAGDGEAGVQSDGDVAPVQARERPESGGAKPESGPRRSVRLADKHKTLRVIHVRFADVGKVFRHRRSDKNV